MLVDCRRNENHGVCDPGAVVTSRQPAIHPRQPVDAAGTLHKWPRSSSPARLPHHRRKNERRNGGCDAGAQVSRSRRMAAFTYTWYVAKFLNDQAVNSWRASARLSGLGVKLPACMRFVIEVTTAFTGACPPRAAASSATRPLIKSTSLSRPFK